MENIWITKAEYVKGYEIELSFKDGSSEVVDFKPYLDRPIFQPLNDEEFFKRFKLGSWTLEWENGADFAPEFLYEKCRKELARV